MLWLQWTGVAAGGSGQWALGQFCVCTGLPGFQCSEGFLPLTLPGPQALRPGFRASGDAMDESQSCANL